MSQDYLELTEKLPELSPQKMSVIPYLALGARYDEIERLLKVKQEDIASWISTDPVFLGTLREYKDKYGSDMARMARLIHYRSLQVIWEQLNTPVDSNDVKSTTEIVKLAKFVIENSDKFAIRQTDPDEASGGAIGRASDGTFDIIARKLHSMKNGNLATHSSVKIRSQTVGNTDRIVVCHKDTDFGTLNYNADSGEYQCHVCGGWHKDMTLHVYNAHGMSMIDYMRDYDIADFVNEND